MVNKVPCRVRVHLNLVSHPWWLYVYAPYVYHCSSFHHCNSTLLHCNQDISSPLEQVYVQWEMQDPSEVASTREELDSVTENNLNAFWVFEIWRTCIVHYFDLVSMEVVLKHFLKMYVIAKIYSCNDLNCS